MDPAPSPLFRSKTMEGFNDPGNEITPGTKTSDYKKGVGSEFGDSKDVAACTNDNKTSAPEVRSGASQANDAEHVADLGL